MNKGPIYTPVACYLNLLKPIYHPFWTCLYFPLIASIQHWIMVVGAWTIIIQGLLWAHNEWIHIINTILICIDIHWPSMEQLLGFIVGNFGIYWRYCWKLLQSWWGFFETLFGTSLRTSRTFMGATLHVLGNSWNINKDNFRLSLEAYGILCFNGIKFWNFFGDLIGNCEKYQKPHSRTKWQKPHDNFLNQNWSLYTKV